MKYAENLVANNFAKTTGIRSGTEVEFRCLVCLIVFCRFKTHLNNCNNYVLHQWAAEEKELLTKAQKN